MPQGPYGEDPGRGDFTLEPQGMPVMNFFNRVWGPVKPFGPGHGLGPGPVPNVPMYRDTWGGQVPDANPMDDILPPSVCPQPCPTTVRADLCAPSGRPASPWDSPDPFGDPSFSPAGVRTVPEWETNNGVKSVPGGSALVGPGGMFVFPAPQLPASPRGTVVPAGVAVGPPGAVSTAAPTKSKGLLQQIPWWGWIAAGVVVWQIVGKR